MAAQLAQALAATTAPHAEPRRQAEEYLKQAALQPGYCLNLLQLLATPGTDETVAQCGAVAFKNFVKKRWAPGEPEGVGQAPLPAIPEAEKDQVKGHLTSLMLSAAPRVRAQLSEALAIVAKTDFPERWPGLVPELVSKFGCGDFKVVNGVLAAADSIFEHFRHEFKSNELYAELRYVLDNFVGTSQGPKPFLELFKSLRPLVQGAAAQPEACAVLLETVRLSCRVFLSLNSQELPEVFEDTIKDWMDEFHFYLGYDNPAVEALEKDPELPTAVSLVKAAVCDNVNLYIERNEEEFQPYLTGEGGVGYSFALDVWNLLTQTTMGKRQDEMVTTAIKFLTTVSKSVHHAKVFGTDESLVQIVERVALPNMQVREEDEELFEMNFVEYIRRDMEGSDKDTRRRSACELVKALTSKFPEKVTGICSQYVNTLLAQHAQNPAENWKAKDCILYLVMALTVMGKTEARGATTTNNLINIVEFFGTHIVPELQNPDVNHQPMLKADALKFLITFRSQIPKETGLALMGNLVNLLRAESNVVHSYAATCIERMLAQKDGPTKRYTTVDLGPMIQPLLSSLFACFGHAESEMNEYVMKCIMRVIAFLEKGVAPIAPMCAQALAEKLVQVCTNPVNSNFNHYAFEAMAALIRYGQAADSSLLAQFEKQLFPVIETVLQNDVEDFAPYVFQLMAQLVELHAHPLPDVYMSLFQPLLSPVLWERTGNVPGLVRLLQAYLEKAAISAQQMLGVLGVFQKLISSKAFDHQGFFILNALLEHVPQASLEPHLGTIWSLLLTRLQTSQTAKFVRGFILCFSLFVAKHSAQKLVEVLDKLQPGLFLMLVQQIMVPKVHTVQGSLEEKLCAVGMTLLLCDVPALQQNQAAWGGLLSVLVTYLEQATTDAGGDDEEGTEAGKGYSAAYAQLHFARRAEVDPLPDVKDAKVYLANALSNTSKGSPGTLPAIISSALQPNLQQALMGYCQAAGVAIH